MHDIDATSLEGDFHQDPRFASESPLDEADATELAADLLEVTSDAELDHFLGDLVRKAASSVKSFVSSPVGQAVVGGLKGLAKQVLPAAGAALGNAIAPGMGGAIGQKLGSAAGSALEQGSDQDIEMARRFVHMAGTAIRKAEETPRGTPPSGAARKAIMDAANAMMPELLRGKGARPGNTSMVPVSHAPRRARDARAGAEAPVERLAADLLEVGSDEELDQFLGDLVNKAVSGIKSFASSPIGKTLVGGLKSIAKTALPMAAGALGNLVVPGVGGAIGGALGSAAANAFEGEEGFLGSLIAESDGEEGFLADLLGEREEGFLADLLGEDAAPKPIEKAKDVVKVAASAAKKAAAAPAGASIHATVKKAIGDAIKQHAPDLLTAPAAHAPTVRQRMAAREAGGAKGQWFRRGNKIIIVGV
jgi:uncharacterized protein (DUF697 family)